MATIKEKASSSLPQTVPLALDDRFARLEEKFVALEKKYAVLQEKALTSTEAVPDNTDHTPVGKVAPSNVIEEAKKATTEENGRPKSRAKIVINKDDPTTGERRDHPLSDSLNPQATETTDHAFILRKNVYKNTNENNGEVEIKSSKLWDLLKKCLGHFPNHIFQGPPGTLYSPFEGLILNWKTLEDVAGETPSNDEDKQARSDLKLLLDTISNGSGDSKLDKYFKIRESLKLTKSVTFEALWTIFPPGALIFGKPFQGQDQVFLVQDNKQPWPPSEKHPWTLKCWAYDRKSTKFRRTPLHLEFEHFEGQKPIASLQYYPFESHTQQASVKKHLIERGRLFRKFSTAEAGSRMCEYKGDAILVQQGFSGAQENEIDDDSGLRFAARRDIFELEQLRRRFRYGFNDADIVTPKSTYVESRVMVDYKSYFLYGPNAAHMGSAKSAEDAAPSCSCSECQGNEELQARYRTKFDRDSMEKSDWDEEQLMLCPPRVLGYVLREKKWAQLQVSNLSIVPEDDGINCSLYRRLKLSDGDETKKMILNLVKSHGLDDVSSGNGGLMVDDIIARKGKGLVILLYGPPGVGKTSTAETVAIAARKPLFSISVADVGTKAKDVESRLARIFDLATSWQAILLFDEADVFLESRGKGAAGGTERNALVSVFLRVLEYYQGILMLTTNQIAQFDVAVQSRVHIAIKYTKLNNEQTRAIFKGFLDPLVRKGLVKDVDDIRKWIKDDVCRMDLDGRQIRNVVTSALGLARARGNSKLEKQDLKTVCNNIRDFKEDFMKQFEKYKNEQLGMVGH